MPQPLSSLGMVDFTLPNVGNYPLEKNPNLLRLAMRVIAAGSNLESFVSNIFANLLGQNVRMGVAIYKALLADSAQLAALGAAAGVALEKRPGERALLEALLNLRRKVSKPRNIVAHWIWGYAPAKPDAVLLVDPMALIDHSVDLTEFLGKIAQQKQENGKNSLEIPPMESSEWLFPEPDMKRFYYYTAADFESAILAIENLTQYFIQYRHLLATAAGSSEAAQLYSQLCNEPTVNGELVRLRKKTPST